MLEIINNLRKKVEDMKSEIGRVYEKIPNGGIYSYPEIGATKKPPLELVNGNLSISRLISRLDYAENWVYKAEDYYQAADDAEKKVWNSSCFAADDAIEGAERDYEAIEKRLSKWRVKQKTGHLNKKDKLKYNPAEVLKYYIDAYLTAAKPIKDGGNNNPKFIGIHGQITEDAMKHFSLGKRTLQEEFPHKRIKREISRLQIFKNKEAKTIKKK